MLLRLVTLFAVASTLFANHKIIYMIAAPRTLSTVFMRMMESRGDCAIYNEPMMPVYGREFYKDIVGSWFKKDTYKTFEDVKQVIYDSQKTSHVFVKDMSFSCHHYFLHNREFLQDPSIHFVFLLRDPHHSSISFYAKSDKIYDYMSDLIGLKKMWSEYLLLQELSPNPVKIIFSENFHQNPRETMTRLSHHVGIPFKEECLTWKKHGKHHNVEKIWHEQKVPGSLHNWHERALMTTHLETLEMYGKDQNGVPTFEEVSDPEDRIIIEKIYDENLPYYLKFLKAKKDHL